MGVRIVVGTNVRRQGEKQDETGQIRGMACIALS